MSTTKKLLPLTDLSKVEFIDKESGDIKIKYMKGMPRQYRFDASKGFFNIKGNNRLTNKGDSFTIIPIAFQVFTDEILGGQYGKMRWIELIFLNEALQVCSMLLHGYSVDNLMSKADELFYDDANFCQVKLTIKPVEKTSSNPVAKGAKYWMCFFGYELIDKKELAQMETAINGLELYRKSTYTANRVIELSQNYGMPEDMKELNEAAKKAGKEITKAESEKEVKPAAAG